MSSAHVGQTGGSSTEVHPLPPLTTSDITKLAGEWNDGGLWADIRAIALEFSGADREPDRRRHWHHLVLAVGNFKRDGGRRLHPAALTSGAVSVESADTSLAIPGADLVLGLEDEESWDHLRASLRGAASATTTTLLAALWPSHHFVFDWRVHAAANGIRLRAQLPTSVPIDPASARGIASNLACYRVVRGWLLRTAASTGQSLTAVERSLYELSRVTDSGRRRTTARTWGEYAEVLVRNIPADTS